jgi:hypothetical protein
MDAALYGFVKYAVVPAVGPLAAIAVTPITAQGQNGIERA